VVEVQKNSVVKECGGFVARKPKKATESDGESENSQKLARSNVFAIKAEEWRCISLFSGREIREKKRYRRY
jgi:hypothetical protein